MSFVVRAVPTVEDPIFWDYAKAVLLSLTPEMEPAADEHARFLADDQGLDPATVDAEMRRWWEVWRERTIAEIREHWERTSDEDLIRELVLNGRRLVKENLALGAGLSEIQQERDRLEEAVKERDEFIRADMETKRCPECGQKRRDWYI